MKRKRLPIRTLRGLLLRLRSCLIPWCMRAGCWRRSSDAIGHRGNLCDVCFLLALFADLEDTPSVTHTPGTGPEEAIGPT